MTSAGVDRPMGSVDDQVRSRAAEGRSGENGETIAVLQVLVERFEV